MAMQLVYIKRGRAYSFGVRRLVGAFESWRLVASIVATSRDIESGDKSPHSTPNR